MRFVLEDGPPEQRSSRHVADVLEVQEPVVLERRVVKNREMPEEIRRQPEAERDGSAGEQLEAAGPPDRGGESRRDAEYEQRRRPLGEHDVLEQMRRKEVVRQRVQRGDCGGEQEQAAGGESGNAPALCFAVPDGQEVRESEAENGERCLGMKRPRVRVRAGDSATLRSHARA